MSGLWCPPRFTVWLADCPSASAQAVYLRPPGSCRSWLRAACQRKAQAYKYACATAAAPAHAAPACRNGSCRFCTGFCCAFVTRRHRECLWPCGRVAAALPGEAHLAGRFDEPSLKHLQFCHLADVLADTRAPCLAGPSGAASGRRRRIRLTGKAALPTQLPSPCRVPATAHRSRASSAKSTRPSATSPGGQAATVPCLNLLLLLTGAGCAAGPSHACHQARCAPCQRLASCAPAILEAGPRAAPRPPGGMAGACDWQGPAHPTWSALLPQESQSFGRTRQPLQTLHGKGRRGAGRQAAAGAERPGFAQGGRTALRCCMGSSGCMHARSTVVHGAGAACGRSCVRQELCRCIMRWWGAGCTTGYGSTTQQHTHSVMPQACMRCGKEKPSNLNRLRNFISPRSKT